MFIIQEIQTNSGVSTALPTVTKQTENEAESAWHSILAAAAISNVEIHTAVMYDETGNSYRACHYEHPIAEE